MPMNNIIDLDQTVKDICTTYPEVKDILIELGFKPLANPLMFNALASKTTLRKGARIARIPLQLIIQTLQWNGYEIKGADNND